MKFLGLPSYYFSILVCSHRTIATPVATLTTSKIRYKGISIGPFEHFLNVKFAHDTSGSRRFAHPVPFVPESGTEIEATTRGAACPQTKDAMPPFFDETSAMSEDCLNLRIARPSGTTSKNKLPVVVWLHGGGVVKGSAYDSHFEPDNLIQHSMAIERPILYVALQYRLTIFGFARSEVLKNQSSLNVGMRDQMLALELVKENIKAFGGDPDKITVFGLNAGGTFATLHLVAYAGEKGVPFNQIWTMSGPPGTALNISSDVSEFHTSSVAQRVGCTTQCPMEMLQCLRDTPMKSLLEAVLTYSVDRQPPAGLFTFVPSIDDDIFPSRPSDLYNRGLFVKCKFHLLVAIPH
jgi:carboxylesterase type B